jgi:phosphoglucosamine mutase
MNIPCKDDLKHSVVEKAEKILKKKYANYSDFSAVDGVRQTFQDGWVLIRASGTEPFIRITVEGQSLKAAKRIVKENVRIVEELVGDKRK